MKDLEKVIKSTITNQAIKQVYPMISIGWEVFQELFKQHNKLLDSDLFDKNLKTRLINFLIYRQFQEDILTDKFYFDVEIRTTNRMGLKTVLLHKNDMIINLSKSFKSNKLPYKSGYRLDLCEHNKQYNKQLNLDLDFQHNMIQDDKVFGFLTYNFDANGIKFVNLVIPNYDMSNIIHNYDIMDRFIKLNNLRSINKTKKNIKVKLKDELKREFGIN